ncbi:hypothetical protein DB346_03430 [Verrucomicrobia bacterium LW23]|nr:hypothetical protein DB346_03430 [Verrucomicrobia bacterium LW23]
MSQLTAMLCTIAVEVPVCVVLAFLLGVFAPPAAALRSIASSPGSASESEIHRAVQVALRVRFARLVVTSAGMSALTHPLLWNAALWWYSQGWSPTTGLWTLEALVTLAEAALLRLGAAVPWRQALLLSIAANAASVAVGICLTWQR